MDTRIFWIWLQQAIGCGNPQSGPLLSHFLTPEAVYDADKKKLKQAGFRGGLGRKLCDKSLKNAERILRETTDFGGWVLTPDDDYYPNLLRGIYGVPLVLYGKGKLPDIDNRPTFAIVGTRRASSYGIRSAKYIAASLAAGGMTVISGGARGIDASAHEGALDGGGTTIAVQACGLDVDYPAENAELRKRILASGGALISEYPLKTPPLKENFPIRNRLISGLSLGVCVVEAPSRSGALITARFAREQGREVFAVPGDITSSWSAGSNKLIQGGAQLARSGTDILQEYSDRFGSIISIKKAEKVLIPARADEKPPVLFSGKRERAVRPAAQKRSRISVPPTAQEPECKKKPDCPQGLSDDAKKVFDALEMKPIPVDELAARAGIPASRTLVALTELELFGCVESSAGQQYRLVGR